MQRYINVALVLLNGFLGWLINQIPRNKPLDPYILGMTGGCVLLIIVLTLLTDDSQGQTGTSNSAWLSSLFPLLGGGILFALFASNSLPDTFKPYLFYTSLFLFSIGMLLPVLLALFKVRKMLRRVLYPLLFGIGLFLTIHFYWNRQWIIGTLALILTVIILLAPLIIKFIEELAQDFEARIKPLIDSSLALRAKSIIRKLVFVLTSSKQSKYYQSLIYACRDYQTQGLKTKGPFTLDLEKVFVPLRIAPESAARISSQMIQGRDESNQGLGIWDFLAASLTKPQFRTLAVIGAPGSGKTTLLKHLTLTYAKNSQRKQHRKAPKLIPVLIYLRNEEVQKAIATQNPPNLATLIEQQSSINKLKLPPRWFEERLRYQKCLVMLDGLDEVAKENQRQAVSDWVKQQIQDYPQALFLVTSRPFGFKSAPVEGVTELEVQPFNLTQMQQFIHSWYLQGEVMSRLGKEDEGVREEAQQKADDLINRIKNSPPLAAMALNPLLLTMIATVHYYRGALPEGRVELYAEICDVLLGRRQEAKGIRQSLTVSQKKPVLQVLALGLMEKNTREFTLALAGELIQEELAKVTNCAPQKFLKDLENNSGLLVEREKGIYEFAHKSFQEYLAAVQIKESNQESLLIDNISNGWWEETIRLYAVQSDATNLIRAALNSRSVISLKLAYDCLEEKSRVEPEVREKLKDILEAGLESDDSDIASLAAQVKLARRLSHLLRIDEQTSIDQHYITSAEYKLFATDTAINVPDFERGTAKQSMTGMSLADALGFCVWLSDKAALLKADNEEGLFFYRLPTLTEAQKYPAQEYDRLRGWTVGDKSIIERGIRIVQAKIRSQYDKLIKCLAAENWEEADRETLAVMIEIADRENQGDLDLASIENFSCPDLSLIDQLWLHYSKAGNGLGVQVAIWEVWKVNPPSGYLPCLWYLNASSNTRELFSALSQKLNNCGIERSLPQFQFEIVIVNRQGQITKREPKQAQYFTEDLGNNITLEMVAIPGGTFMMGTDDEEIERLCKKYNWDYFRREHPQHEVTVQPFFMGKFQVTQKQWRAIASLPKVERDLKPEPSRFKGNDRPVERVNWYDAVEFCRRLSRETGRDYRLPSEAEWEYACRAGTTTPFYFGETITGELANYRASEIYAGEPTGEYRQETTPVGQFPPNAFGLYDMHGNVWEWCADTWHDSYRGAPTDGSAWTQGGNENRSLLRGGSWDGDPDNCRSALRGTIISRDIGDGIGFRVVCGFGRTL